jgi:hypothetical protein
MTFQNCAPAAILSTRGRSEPSRYEGKGAAMPTNKTTTIQARVSKQDKKFLRDYAESQGITLSELLRRSTTALIQIIKAQQASKRL